MGKMVNQDNQLVTVIVPVYNGEKYIRRCLDSALKQTYENIEIIVVNDGSTDRTVEICESMQKKDERIKIISKKNEGALLARKIGIEAAKGDFIEFMDADDYMDVELIERLYMILKENGADIACCGCHEIRMKQTDNGIDRQILLNHIEAIRRMNYGKDINAAVWGKLYKKELLKNVQYARGISIGEDYRMVWYAMKESKTVVYTSDPLYCYVLRGDSVSHSGHSGNGLLIMKNYIDVANDMKTTFEELGKSADAYCMLQLMAVVISMIKSNLYDMDIILKVKIEVRKRLCNYVIDWRVPPHLKVCALLISTRPQVLIAIYKKLFKWRYDI